MPRTMLTDSTWKKLKQILEESGCVYNKWEHRKTLEGILYRIRTEVQWRDLPSDFGIWNTVYRRFNLWSKKGILEKLFQSLATESDSEWLFIDGSIVKAHQDSAGASDSGGLPVYFEISGGQVHDIVHAENLIVKSPKADYVIAGKGYNSDNDKLRDFIEDNGSQSNIPRRVNSKDGNNDMDWCLYKYRHLVENAFGKLKKYRAIATCYDKLARNFRSCVALVFAVMWLPSRS